MESVKDLLKTSSSQIIELGEIVNVVGTNIYMVSFNGTERKAFSTLNAELQIGERVLVNKLSTGSRYIVNRTGFTGKYKEQKEIFRDG